MATPGRRSTRQSSRTTSPATWRTPRVSPSDIIHDETALFASLERKNKPATASQNLEHDEQEARTASATYGSVVPAGPTSRAKDRTRGKSVVPTQSVVADTGSRSSSRQRKPARITEIIKREVQSSSSEVGAEEEEASAQKGAARLEESGDDEYDPSLKSGKAKKSRKSKDAKEQRPMGIEVDHRTPEGRKQLDEIIDTTVLKSIDQDNELLAIALRRIYHRTFTDDGLADILDSVLSQVATQEETEAFKQYVKEERKTAKKDLATGKITVESAVASENSIRPKSQRHSESKSASPSKPTSPQKPAVNHFSASSTRKNPPKTPSAQPAQNPKINHTPVSTPTNMAVITRRGARRQVDSPTPKSPKKVEISITESLSGPPATATRNSKKRPSSTPEPSAKQSEVQSEERNNAPEDGASDEPPRKKTKLSGEAQSSSSSTLSDLSTSSRESSTEAPDTRSNGLAAKGTYSSTITNGIRVGGNLKRKPEPAQKAKLLAGSKHGLGLPDEEMESHKRQLRRTEYPGYEVQDSSIRDPVKPTERRPAPPPVDVLGVYTPSTREQLEQSSLRSPASSSAQGDYLVPPPPGAAKPSRTGTPVPGSGRRTARVKVSPVKKKNAIVAGLGARAGGRDSPVGFRADGEDSNNVDYCVTCNESGELLCCDGCPRAFHFLCCDPPLEEDNPPTGEWYCYVCENRRDPVPRPPRGLFSILIHEVNRQNASTFRLPSHVRSYFEGVGEGDNGAYSYDDPAMARHRTRATGPTAEIEADNFKMKDSKGNFVLCSSCGKTSTGKREMIKCDHCSQYWHLDCLDPPPANPPVRPLENRSRQLWKCPAHAELDTTLPGVHKLRRPKNFKVVDTMLNRGHRNNGDIEVELDTSDEESETEVNDDGTVFRLTEKSIKLDFVERVKRMNEDQERRKIWVQEIQQARLEVQQQLFDQFNSKSNEEQSAINALVGLRHESHVGRRTNGMPSGLQHAALDMSGRMRELVDGIVKESSQEVASTFRDQTLKSSQANGVSGEIGTPNSSPALKPEPSGIKRQTQTTSLKLAPGDRKALEKLKELISKRLEDWPDSNGENGEGQGVDHKSLESMG